MKGYQLLRGVLNLYSSAENIPLCDQLMQESMKLIIPRSEFEQTHSIQSMLKPCEINQCKVDLRNKYHTNLACFHECFLGFDTERVLQSGVCQSSTMSLVLVQLG